MTVLVSSPACAFSRFASFKFLSDTSTMSSGQMTIVQLAWHHETVLKVAHWMRAKGHPPSLCVGYCEGVRKKWEEASARGDSDFDLNQAVKKVDEDSKCSHASWFVGCVLPPSPLSHVR